VSCETNSNKIGKLAGLRSGVTALSSKAGNVSGAVIGRWAQAQDGLNDSVMRRVAPVSNRLLRAVDRPAVTAAKAAPVVISLLAATRWRGYALAQAGGPPVVALAATLRPTAELARNRQTLNTVQKGIGLVGAVSGLAATLATRGAQERRTLELKEKDKVVATVTFQPAPRLTRLLNKGDLAGSHLLGKNVSASEGEVIRGRGLTSWHRGTSLITVNGAERTITHLQSLRLPGQHLYFNRRLSEAEVAGIVSGRTQGHTLPGYAGEVHPIENLTPLWGATKQGLILTSLYWPTAPDRWSPAVEKSGDTPKKSTPPVNLKTVKPVSTKERQT